MRKRTIKQEKDDITTALEKRIHPGLSTSNVMVDKAGVSKEVDAKQLKRYLKDQIRHQQAEPLIPGV